MADEIETKIANALSNRNFSVARLTLQENPPYFSSIVLDETWLMWVASKGELEFCKFLVESGCNVNARGTALFRDSTALNSAIDGGHIEVVRYLLEQGADPNMGRALFGAIGNKQGNGLEICKLLVKHGVDVNQKFLMFDDPNNVRTALDFAARKPEFADYLRSVGAKSAREL